MGLSGQVGLRHLTDVADAETILEAGDVVLRPWRDTDVPALVEACQDPEITRWVSIPRPYASTDGEAFIEETKPM